MSHVYKVRCSGCNHQSRLSIGGKNYILEVNGDLKDNIQSKFAFKYCRSCDQITDVFLGTACESWELSTAKETYSQLQQKYNNTSNINFFKKSSLKEKLQSLELKIARLKNANIENEMFWHGREVKPKCMTCGGTDIDPTDIRLPYNNEIATNVIHTCGGKLLISLAMKSSSLTTVQIFYDVEGNRLREEERRLD